MVSTKNRNFWIIIGVVFLISAIVSFINKSPIAWTTLLVSAIDFFIAYRENEKIKAERKEIEEAKMQAKADKKAHGKKKKKSKKRK
ncbi:hypothetical protein [Faecalimicrobium sp. JNUCC 81]